MTEERTHQEVTLMDWADDSTSDRLAKIAAHYGLDRVVTYAAGSPIDHIVWLLAEVARLQYDLKHARRQTGTKDEVLHRKNLELDALHFVWCSGACRGGVHRWSSDIVTEEIVAEAERNTTRLRQWYDGVKWRYEHHLTTADDFFRKIIEGAAAKTDIPAQTAARAEVARLTDRVTELENMAQVSFEQAEECRGYWAEERQALADRVREAEADADRLAGIVRGLGDVDDEQAYVRANLNAINALAAHREAVAKRGGR
jgi:hypothetical protein